MTEDQIPLELNMEQLSTELKQKIKEINPNLEDESKIENIIEKSLDLIIINKVSHSQCMQKISEYFNKDFQKTKFFVDFLCEKTNIPLKYEISQLNSKLEIPPFNKDYNPFKKKEINIEHLKLKRNRSEENASCENNLLKDLKKDNQQNEENYIDKTEKENLSPKNSLSINSEPCKQTFHEKISHLNFSSVSTYSSYKPNNTFYNGPYIKDNLNYNFPNHIIVEEQPIRRIYVFNGNERNLNSFGNYCVDDYNKGISSFTPNNNFKIKIKCKDWPNCKTINCPYIHPKEMCPFFPKCKFGDKCFYIHPLVECKFGKNCKKNDCPYSHPK